METRRQAEEQAAREYYEALAATTPDEREEANHEAREHLNEYGHSFAGAIVRIIKARKA